MGATSSSGNEPVAHQTGDSTKFYGPVLVPQSVMFHDAADAI